MLLMLLDSIGQTLLSFVRDHRRLQNVSVWDRCCLLDLVKITGQSRQIMNGNSLIFVKGLNSAVFS